MLNPATGIEGRAMTTLGASRIIVVVAPTTESDDNGKRRNAGPSKSGVTYSLPYRMHLVDAVRRLWRSSTLYLVHMPLEPQATIPMSSSLLHLPNELILDVLEYHEGSPLEDDRTFRNLALSCRRLFTLLLLPRYLNHLRALVEQNKLKIIKNEQSPSLHSGQLNLDIYGSSLHSISYIITHKVAKDLCYLHGLIARAPRVHRVELMLEMTMYEQTILGPIPEGGIEVFSSLFNICIEKEGLTLSITGQPMGWGGEGGPFRYEVEPPPQSKFALLASRRREIGQNYIRPQKTSYLTKFWDLLHPIFTSFGNPIDMAEDDGVSEWLLEDQPQPVKYGPTVFVISPSVTAVANYKPSNPLLKVQDPKLSGIEINSPIFFRSSWYSTTLNLLNASPITRLSFGNTGLNLYDWIQILPSITIPGLTDFAIGESGIAYPDLFTFLQRHPQITTLSLSNSFCIGRVELPAERNSFLPRLAKLIGAAEYLAPLLQDKDDYPLLESVRLTQESAGFQEDQVNEFIRNLSRRSAAGPQELCLHLRYEKRLAEWLTASALKPFNELLRNLKSVKKLEVMHDRPNSWSPTVQEKLIAWIMLLPCVEEVGLSEAANTPEWEAWRVYGHSIWSQCPHLQKFRIGTRLYSRESGWSKSGVYEGGHY